MRSSRRRSFAPWRTAACWVGSATGDMAGSLEEEGGVRGAGSGLQWRGHRVGFIAWSRESREGACSELGCCFDRTECPCALLIDIRLGKRRPWLLGRGTLLPSSPPSRPRALLREFPYRVLPLSRPRIWSAARASSIRRPSDVPDIQTSSCACATRGETPACILGERKRNGRPRLLRRSAPVPDPGK